MIVGRICVVVVAVIVLVGGVVGVFFVIRVIVVLGCRRICSCLGFCVVEVIVSHVCVVALPSNLSKYSKPWCLIYVFGVVGVVFDAC